MEKLTLAAVTGLADENVVVIPVAGTPVTVIVTPPVNAPVRVMATTVFAVCPAVMEAVVGVSEMLIAPPNPAVTVSAMEAV